MISPVDFIELSKELLDSTPPTEVKFRTAISRAYYGAYLFAAVNYASHVGIELSDGVIQSHQRFINELKSHRDKKLQKLGNQLFQLKKAREDADYKINIDINKSKAAVNYTLAIKLKDSVNSFFSNSKIL